MNDKNLLHNNSDIKKTLCIHTHVHNNSDIKKALCIHIHTRVHTYSWFYIIMRQGNKQQSTSYLSSCHSAMCLPGVAMTSFQCLNSSPAHCPQRITWPSSRLLVRRLSFSTEMLTAAFLICAGSTVQVRASLKMGEQLCAFFLVLKRPRIRSPPKVIHILACTSKQVTTPL